MKPNLGSYDRWLRIAGGIALIAMAVSGGLIGDWGYLGVIPLATGLLNYCPVYSLFDIKTCQTPDAAKR